MDQAVLVLSDGEEVALDLETLVTAAHVGFAEAVAHAGHLLDKEGEITHTHIPGVHRVLEREGTLELTDLDGELLVLGPLEVEVLDMGVLPVHLELDAIFEIIEEFVDQDDLYKSFIDFILKSYWDKINLIFYQSAPILKDKNNKMYSKALLEFEEAEKLSDICIQLLDKFNLNQNNSNYITIKDLKNLKLKIKVRKEIIKFAKKMN